MLAFLNEVIISILVVHPYNISTFKTKAPHLVRNEVQIKCLLLLHKRLIQLYLSLETGDLFCYWVTHIDGIDSKSHKMELKSSCNYLINHISQNNATSYLWPRGNTHTHTHSHIQDCIKVISINQPRVGCRLVHAWFKKAWWRFLQDNDYGCHLCQNISLLKVMVFKSTLQFTKSTIQFILNHKLILS